MCGRYANFHSTDAVVRAFGIDRIVAAIEPSWNVAPTQNVEIIRDDGAPRLRELVTARWGLVPSWSAGPGSGPLLINARSETLTVKPAFRAAAARRRAIVPASGYYEWQTQSAGPKIPYFLHPPTAEPLAFAGVYEWWGASSSNQADDDGPHLSVTIVTRAAPDALGQIHDRMPVVVPQGMVGDWLDPAVTAAAAVAALLEAMPAPVLTPRPVLRLVNSVRHNGPELIRGVGAG